MIAEVTSACARRHALLRMLVADLILASQLEEEKLRKMVEGE
jgi:hypothetical protein